LPPVVFSSATEEIAYIERDRDRDIYILDTTKEKERLF
jgi:hypothetical protein